MRKLYTHFLGLQRGINFQMERMSEKVRCCWCCWPLALSMSYPDLTVEEPVVDVLVETLLWVHIDAVSFQVLLDLGSQV